MAEHNAKKISLAFRVDSGIKIGSGHLMRCLTLAQAFAQDGHGVRFICRDHQGSMHKKILDYGFELTLLDMPAVTDVKNPRNLTHGEFLGVSQKSDAESCRDLPIIKNCDVLVVDHYGIDFEWEQAIALTSRQILVTIDDLADRNHVSDLLLDQNYYKNISLRYKDRLPLTCRQLLGPSFALVRPQFQAAIATQASPLIPYDLKGLRILVAFGGADSHGWGLKVCAAILETFMPQGVICELMGDYSLSSQEKALKNKYLSHINMIGYTNEPWNVMSKCDLYVGAGGSVSWERCVLGKPAIVYAVSANQIEMSKDLADAGYQIFLGDIQQFAPESLVNAISQLTDDHAAFAQMSTASSALVDGKGVERVKREIYDCVLRRQNA